METFNTAAAETKAPRPCLQIALTNNPIEIRTLKTRTVGSGKRGLDGPVWADLIIMCMFDHGHRQSHSVEIKWRSKKGFCYGFKIQDCHLLLTLAKNKLTNPPRFNFPNSFHLILLSSLISALAGSVVGCLPLSALMHFCLQ